MWVGLDVCVDVGDELSICMCVRCAQIALPSHLQPSGDSPEPGTQAASVITLSTALSPYLHRTGHLGDVGRAPQRTRTHATPDDLNYLYTYTHARARLGRISGLTGWKFYINWNKLLSFLYFPSRPRKRVEIANEDLNFPYTNDR